MSVNCLVVLNLERNRLDQVREAAAECESRLFDAKVEAYRSSRVEKIFDYHRSLGKIYALTGNWGDERTVASAIFQLDHALETYDRLEVESPEKAAEKYRYTPELTDLLARGYAQTGRLEKSYLVRLEAAERYQARGDQVAAAEVIEPIREQPPPETVAARTRTRYGEVLAKTPATLQPLLFFRGSETPIHFDLPGVDGSDAVAVGNESYEANDAQKMQNLIDKLVGESTSKSARSRKT